MYPYIEEPLESAWRACAAFHYYPDVDAADSWKSPREFERDGGGDCEDFAVFLTYHLGREAAVLGVRMNNSETLHAIVEYRGELIEPAIYGRKYKPESMTVLRRYSYDEAMAISTANGTK